MPNVRIVVIGVPRAEKAFVVVEVSKAQVQREAEAMARELEAEKRRLEASIRSMRGR